MPEENTNTSDDSYRSNFRLPRRANQPNSNYADFRRPVQPLGRASYRHDSPDQQSQAPLKTTNEPVLPQAAPLGQQSSTPTADNDLDPNRGIGSDQSLARDLPLDDDIDSLFPVRGDKLLPPPISTAPLKREARLPKGVYLFILFDLALSLLSLFVSANLELALTCLMIINLVAVSGLLMKKARYMKLASYIAIGIASLCLSLIALFYLQAAITNATFVKNYNEIKSPAAQKLSISQKQILANNQAQVILRRNKQLGAARLFYVDTALGGAGALSMVYYLKRNKVKAYFK